MTPADEAAVREALSPELRALFTVSVHPGFRWSEQAGLRWADVNFLTGLITVSRSKSGHSRSLRNFEKTSTRSLPGELVYRNYAPRL
jgi:integrase